MKRWFFISGIVLILVLAGVWIFLLFASDETKRDIYNSFGLTGEEEGIPNIPTTADLPDLPPENTPLRQLTTRRVAGYTEVAIASTSPMIMFVEAGTGHIYKLNLQDSSETRVSNITIPGAKEAVIDPTGNYAAIKSGDKEGDTLTIVSLFDETPASEDLGEEVFEFSITATDQLLYTTTGASGIVARSKDLKNGSFTTLFSLPFWHARVIFAKEASGTHYVYPKTTRLYEGYLYSVTDGLFTRTPISGFGLAADLYNSDILFTGVINNEYTSFIYNVQTGSAVRSYISLYPEKCAVATSAKIIYCGSGSEFSDTNFPDNWYRGEVTFTDNLWGIDPNTTEATFLLDTLEMSGRQLDIIAPLVSQDDFSLYFKNKIDHTLWAYDLTYNNVTE